LNLLWEQYTFSRSGTGRECLSTAEITKQIGSLFSVAQGSESPNLQFYFIYLFIFGGNSGLHTCKTGALPLEPHFQSILLWIF
jgi:hypothetical protein